MKSRVKVVYGASLRSLDLWCRFRNVEFVKYLIVLNQSLDFFRLAVLILFSDFHFIFMHLHSSIHLNESNMPTISFLLHLISISPYNIFQSSWEVVIELQYYKKIIWLELWNYLMVVALQNLKNFTLRYKSTHITRFYHIKYGMIYIDNERITEM